MPSVLKGCNIAVTGDFGEARSSDNLRRWIQLNGGRYTTKIDGDTTHLIASKDHWKRQVDAVKTARRARNAKIVQYDWLEDSLQGKSKKREKKYLWTEVEKKHTKLKQHRQAVEARILKKDATAFGMGTKGAMTDLMSDLYHLYVDATGFTYALTLTRINIRTNTSERIHLKIYETHTKPHAYCTFYRHSGSSLVAQALAPSHAELTPRASNYATAFAAFREKFAACTGYAWEARADKFAVARALALATDEIDRAGRMARAEGRKLSREEREGAERKGRVFKYELPEKGMPRGEMPQKVLGWPTP